MIRTPRFQHRLFGLIAYLLALLSVLQEAAASLTDDECTALFENITTLTSPWLFTGHIQGFNYEIWGRDLWTLQEETPNLKPSDVDYPLAIKYADIVERCGVFGGFDSMDEIADTIALWALPILMLFILLTWESNKRRSTLKMLFRWPGSPITTLVYLLWNINITRTCALMVDLSCLPHNENVSNDVDFSMARDSLIVLSAMNQYQYVPDDRTAISGEGDEEFADVDHLMMDKIREAIFSTAKDVVKKRKKIAYMLREKRKTGIVQIFLSILGFFGALGISMFKAFGKVGDTQTAYNLTLGLWLAWLPILVTANVIDRNAMESEYVRKLLNKLMRRFHGTSNDVFAQYAGQARVRWHYGIAHKLLGSMEDWSIGTRRRIDWFEAAAAATHAPKSKSRTRSRWRSFFYFSKVELVFVIIAHILVLSCDIGGMYIAYFSPPIGVGCHTISYLLYSGMVTVSTFMEIMVYPYIYQRSYELSQPHQKKSGLFPGVIKILDSVLLVLDILSTTILFLTLVFQTVGFYNLRRCEALTVDKLGGFAVFNGTSFFTRYFGVINQWATGTLTACIPLVLAVTYLLEQWLTQSFFWTEDESKALRGLLRVRQWQWIIYKITFNGRLNIFFFTKWKWMPCD